MPTAPSIAAGVLTVAETADMLGCSVIHVLRLIARGQLKATRLRANARSTSTIGKQVTSELRILSSEVARFLHEGAPDFEAPEFSGDSWFADLESAFVDTARAELAAACESQVLSDQEVIARFKRETENRVLTDYVESVARSHEVKLRATEEVLAASKSARLAAKGIAMKQALRRCRTWLKLLAVSRLRSLARGCIVEAQEALELRAGVIKKANPTISTDSLNSFYNSEIYDTVCQLALAKLKETKAVFFRRSTQLPNAMDGQIVVAYSLPFSAIQFDEQQLFDIAF